MNYLLSEANKNTFVLFDCLEEGPKDTVFFNDVHRILLNEKRDDALILLGKKPLNDEAHPLLQMLVLGRDGTFGEFCGNGALSCAAYLFDRYQDKSSFTLESISHKSSSIRRENNQYVVNLPRVRRKLNEKFITSAVAGFEYVEILEPHLTIQSVMGDEQLYSIGRALNQQRNIFPLGINVNAWHITDKDQIFVRTYERGVQNLTQSCGSGSACCAALFRDQGVVRVATQGGNLVVDIQKDAIFLKGKATYRNSV